MPNIKTEKPVQRDSKGVSRPLLEHKRGSVVEINMRNRWTDTVKRDYNTYIRDNFDYVMDNDYLLIDS